MGGTSAEAETQKRHCLSLSFRPQMNIRIPEFNAKIGTYSIGRSNITMTAEDIGDEIISNLTSLNPSRPFWPTKVNILASMS